MKAGVKKLILTHISRRYREKDVSRKPRHYFRTRSVARDFDTFQIKREEKNNENKRWIYKGHD